MKKLTYIAFAILLALASCQKYDHKGITDKRAEQRIHDNFVKLVQYY